VVRPPSFDLLISDLAKAMAPVGGGANDMSGAEDELDPIDAAILKVMKQMAETMASQSQTIRALQVRLTALDGGRAAPLAKALGRTGFSGAEFMAKAVSAHADGRITGLDVATAEQLINSGQQPSADIVRAVVGV
jgi:hypothetical protein